MLNAERGSNLEAEQNAPNVPVILLTGYSKRITKETARELDINGFAFKPIVKKNLLNL